MASFMDWLRNSFGPRPVDPAVAQLRNFEQLRLEAAAALPFERVETTGAAALSTWGALRDAGRGWPVVVGGDEALGILAEGFSASSETPEQILAAADALRMPTALHDFRKREDETARAWLSENNPAALAQARGEDASPEVGAWPTKPAPSTDLSVAVDHHDKPLDKVHILLVPARTGAEVPAYLRWGGWNACPAPEYHVAALRDWDARYGLELVGMSYDVLNLRVTRKPATREAALELAREQFVYCEDLVYQGTETLSNLAASLMAHEWWYFWWD